MAFKVIMTSSVTRKIASWQLSDFVLVDVNLHLRELLPTNSSQLLRRETSPFDGLVYRFSLIDSENRLREHFFLFQIVFSQDEESLIVAQAAYHRSDGM